MIIKMFKMLYKKINNKIVNEQDNERMPLDEQTRMIDSFSNPRDDYERSFYKYKCFINYCYYKKKWLIFLFNIGALFLLPIVYSYFKHNSHNIKNSNMRYDAVIENVPRLPNKDIMPDIILDKYKNIVEIEQLDYRKGYLGKNARLIHRELRARYFFHFYFRLIVLFKLALFDGYIKRYHPKSIIFYSVEREFAGPLQTLLCELEGCKYEAFMHGDYIYTLSFAFQKYSLYYIWDEVYNKMFKSLRCASKTEVYLPQKLNGTIPHKPDDECKYFATYYLSDETDASIELLKSIFESFIRLGLRCKVRPHPRFSDQKNLLRLFGEIEIEDVDKCSIEESISDSLYVIGLSSTVLSQAYFSNKKVVIDDISMRQRYIELRKRESIMMKREHILLSDLIKNAQNQFNFSKHCSYIIK